MNKTMAEEIVNIVLEEIYVDEKIEPITGNIITRYIEGKDDAIKEVENYMKGLFYNE